MNSKDIVKPKSGAPHSVLIASYKYDYCMHVITLQISSSFLELYVFLVLMQQTAYLNNNYNVYNLKGKLLNAD